MIPKTHRNGRAAGFNVNLLGYLAWAFLIASPIYADSAGTSAGDLLRVPTSARAIGMGEAYTAAADDNSALAWNPAGLSFLQQKEAAFMHSSLFEGIHYERVAFAAPADRLSYGGSFSYLGYGSIDGYNNAGAPTGSLSANSYNLTGGLATLVMDRLSLGFTGSYLRQKLADESAGTFAMNAGVLYELASRPLGAAYRLGFAAINMGPGLKFVSESDPLPRKYNFGVAALHVKELPLNLSADLSLPNDNDINFGLGGEYWMKDMFALRLGYAGANDEGSGIRFGFGAKLKDIVLDYALTDQGELGTAHRVELMYRWGDKSHPLNREQRQILKEAKRLQKGGAASGDQIHEILVLNDMLNVDPANDKILKKMIVAHEKILQSELDDALALAPALVDEEEVPSPEEFALQDLVPGQQSIAQAPASYDPGDPLGLSNLPDVPRVEQALSPAPAFSPAVVPAPSAPVVEAMPTPAATPALVTPDSEGVLLKASDIYGE